MVLSFILFAFYLILFSWLLTKSTFITQTGWGTKFIVGLFCIKVATGVLNGWIYSFFPGGDSWVYYTEGLKEYYLLFKNPGEYFSNIFLTGEMFGYKNFFASQNSFWNDLKANLIIKIDSLFDIFSFGNFYINVLFYDFLTFFGIVALYRVFAEIYESKKKLLIFSVILLPSFLFFSSAFHKDGIVIASIGIILFTFYQMLNKVAITCKMVLITIFSFLLLLFFRGYILLLLIPAMIAWYLSERTHKKPWVIYVLLYTFFGIIFFNLNRLIPSMNLMQIIIDKQAAFLSLEKANSYISIELLKPTFGSFCSATPDALINSLFRPFVTDAMTSKFLWPMAIETILYEILFILFLIFPDPDYRNKSKSLILFGVFFGVSSLMITGFTVPVLGAIVRYRSLYLPFILTPVICGINWNNITNKHN